MRWSGAVLQYQDIEASSIKWDFLCAAEMHLAEIDIYSTCECAPPLPPPPPMVPINFSNLFLLFFRSVRLFVRVRAPSQVRSCIRPLISTAHEHSTLILASFSSISFRCDYEFLFGAQIANVDKKLISKLHSLWLASTKFGWNIGRCWSHRSHTNAH